MELEDLETGRNLLIELLSGFDGRLVRARSVVMSGLTRKAEGVSWFAGKEMLDEILGGNWVPKPTEKPKKVSSEEVYNDFRKSLLRVFDAPPVISAERWVRAFAATLTESPDAAMLERFLLRARSVCEESAWVVAVGKLRHDLDEKGADPNLLQEFDRRLGEMGMQKVIEEWRALHRQSVRVKPEEWLKSLRDKSWDESFRCVAEAPKTKECLAGIGVLFEKALPDEDRLLRVIEFAETQAIWCAARHCSEINESFQTLTLNCLELLDAIEDCSQRGQLVGRICEWDYGFNDRNLERYIIGVAKAWAGCGLLDRAIELVEGMPERFDQRKGLAALAIRAGLVSGTSQGVELFKRFVAKLESGKPCVLAFDGAILIASAYANAGNSVMFCRTVEIILERYFSWTKSDRHQSVLSIPIQLAVMFTKLGLADQMIDFLDRMLADVRDCDLVMGGFWYSLSEDLAQVPQAFDRMTQAQRERIVRLLARETRRDPSDEAAIISGLMKGCQDMNSLMALWRESVSDPYSFAGAMTQEWMVLCSVDLLAWPFAVICPFNEEANRWYLQWRVGEAILKRDWEVLRSLHAACPELGLDWALAVVGQ